VDYERKLREALGNDPKTALVACGSILEGVFSKLLQGELWELSDDARNAVERARKAKKKVWGQLTLGELVGILRQSKVLEDLEVNGTCTLGLRLVDLDRLPEVRKVGAHWEPKLIVRVGQKKSELDPTEAHRRSFSLTVEYILRQLDLLPRGDNPPQHPVPQQVWRNRRDDLEYVYCPPRSFAMGAGPQDAKAMPKEKPRHKVRLTAGFWVASTPVTVGAYERFCACSRRPMPPAPRFNVDWARKQEPIVGVTWEDALCYSLWVGGGLPSEARWEYAARAGTHTRFWWGEVFDEEHAWCRSNTSCGTEPVDRKGRNPWLLSDMIGHVWEWCSDWLRESYYAGCPDEDPGGPSSGQRRVIRGGGFGNDENCLRVSYRLGADPAKRSEDIGFRPVIDA